MMRLFVAELRRLLARRITLITAIVLLAAVGLFQFAVNEAVTPPTAAEVAQAQQEAQEFEQECRDDGGSTEECSAENSAYVPTVTSFEDIGSTGMLFVAFVSLLASYLVGASFIGAEYTTGSIANWLAFVPARLRVYGSKLLALVAMALVGTALLAGLTFALMAMITSLHGGDLGGADEVAATGGRTVVMGGVAAIAGFSVALLTRHTVAALGLVLGYLVISQVLVGLSMVVPAMQNLPPWLPEQNVLAFLQYGTTYDVMDPAAGSEDYSSFSQRNISFGHSAAYWAVLVVVALVASAAIFRRRDVT